MPLSAASLAEIPSHNPIETRNWGIEPIRDNQGQFTDLNGDPLVISHFDLANQDIRRIPLMDMQHFNISARNDYRALTAGASDRGNAIFMARRIHEFETELHAHNGLVSPRSVEVIQKLLMLGLCFYAFDTKGEMAMSFYIEPMARIANVRGEIEDVVRLGGLGSRHALIKNPEENSRNTDKEPGNKRFSIEGFTTLEALHVKREGEERRKSDSININTEYLFPFLVATEHMSLGFLDCTVMINTDLRYASMMQNQGFVPLDSFGPQVQVLHSSAYKGTNVEYPKNGSYLNKYDQNKVELYMRPAKNNVLGLEQRQPRILVVGKRDLAKKNSSTIPL